MRRRSIILISLTAVTMIATGAVVAQEIKEEPMTLQQAALLDGEQLYSELCAVCHGTDAKGNGPATPALAAPAPDLTQLALANGGEFPTISVRKTISGQGRTVAHGTLEMPIWGKAFQEARVDLKPGMRWSSARLRVIALTEYIQSIQVETEQK